MVNENTPFEVSYYDFAINTIKEKEKLCNIRGELCKIYGSKFEEIKILFRKMFGIKNKIEWSVK